MTSFEQLGLSEKTLAAVKRLGYSEPTPVQEKAIPLVLEGRDIVAGAQTGTGKTCAFALPVMDKLGHASGGQGPLMLVVTPTRELAQQIGEVAAEIAVSTHHRITTVVGGLSYKPQIERLKHGCDILIATPGRLIDLMDQKAVKLSDIEVLVLDEADRMLDMGFLPSVKRIVNATPSQRQTLLFSATIDASIDKVVGTMLRNPSYVEIARKGEAAATVEQFIIYTPQLVKPKLLVGVLQEKGWNRVIVFARTRRRAETVCRRLKRAGFIAEPIHSDRTQNQRRRALDRFAAGEVNIIVATDVLARGIDVDQVDYVVNYDIPEQAEDYVHRIGRTGRAGQAGFAVTFVTPDNDGELRAIEKLTKKHIPELVLEHFDMDAAKAELAEHEITQQAKRDPEVIKATRELASKKEQKAARRVKTAAEAEAAAAKRAKRKKKPTAATSATTASVKKDSKPAPAISAATAKRPNGKPASSSNEAPRHDNKPAPATNAPGTKKRTKPASAPSAATRKRVKPTPASSSTAKKRSIDMRPGRAHRAEVNRRRKSSPGAR